MGDDVENIVLRLLQAADQDVAKAQCGIIYVDEIDKIGSDHRGDPASALLNLSLLGDFLTLRFYNDGEEVDRATVGGGLLGLELLGLSLDSDERFLSAEVDTNELTFDEVQLDYAGLLNVNGSLRVHRVCAGNDPEDAP